MKSLINKLGSENQKGPEFHRTGIREKDIAEGPRATGRLVSLPFSAPVPAGDRRKPGGVSDEDQVGPGRTFIAGKRRSPNLPDRI